MANARTKKPAAKQAARGRAAAPAKAAGRGRPAAKQAPKRGAAPAAKRGAAKAPARPAAKRAAAPAAKKPAAKQAPKAAPKRAAAPAPKQRKTKSNLFDVNVWLNEGFRTIELSSSEAQELGLNVTYKDHTGAEKSELVLFPRLVSYSDSVAIIKDRVLVDSYEDVTVTGEGNFLDVTTEDGANATIYRQPDYTIEIVPAGNGAARGAVEVEAEEEGDDGEYEEGGEEEYAEEGGEDGEYEEGEYEEGEYEEGGEEEYAEEGEYEEGGEEGEYEEGEYDDSEGYEEGEEGEGDGFSEDYEEYEE